MSRLEQQLVEHMTHVDVVDALSDTEHWLNWSRFFGPISGHDAKLENPSEHGRPAPPVAAWAVRGVHKTIPTNNQKAISLTCSGKLLGVLLQRN